ncbi:MAG: alpha/beta hydrolase [Pseudomonadota bacterium]
MWHLSDTYGTSAGTVRAGRTGQGPDLVLAHGWPWSSYAWHRVLPHLAARFTIHWYDMPGFGQSQLDGPRANALNTQGEVFCEMLDHWDLDAPHIIAHDFGGAVTLRAHLLHGRDYAGLVLMNVVALRPWGSDFFDHVGRHIDAFTGLPDHIHAAVVHAYIGGALAQPIPDEDRTALAAPWLTRQGKSAFYAQFALANERHTAELEPHFKDLRCPAAILWGADDPWIPSARGQALAHALSTSFEDMPGLGHLPQLEQPKRVADTLLAALSSVAA